MYRLCEEMPELRRAMRNGNPTAVSRAQCAECGAPLPAGERAFSWTGARGKTAIVCRECFLGLFDELSIEEKAALAGSETVVIGKGA